MLYIVATPIGNRDDISIRALQVLGDVDFIAAEDTRHSGQLLTYFGIKKPLISFRDAPEGVTKRAIDAICDRLAKGEKGAYITDAGTPGISDPGWRLVASALSRDVVVSPLPGASATTSIISLSEVPLSEFRYVGFLPKKKGYQTKLEDLSHYLQAKEPRGVVLYESPKRVRKTLTDFAGILPSAQTIIGRELTKKFETIYRGKLTEEFIKQLPDKGEYVILLHNGHKD